MDEREARMALNSATEPGSAMITALLAEHSPAEVWHQLKAGRHGEPLARRAAAYDPTAAIALARRHRVRLIVPGDVEWPQQLDDLATCEPVQEMRGSPVALWVRGTATLAEAVGRSVAVVGSRAATSYGETTAAELAGGVSSLGISVVSGGAFGVDIAAHRGVLAARGITVAVMAGGLDALYPAANGPVLERVAQEGCLVSELPPGARPTRARFLARNRLIAALSQGTVLVEAAERSGARNTITWANACHRVTMAVPGPVHSATSVTPHRLIREAEAVLVSSPEEVAELVGPLGTRARLRPSQHRPLDALSAPQIAVYEVLPARTSLDAGEISLRAGLPLPTCLAILDQLTEDGLLETSAIGWRIRRASASTQQISATTMAIGP